MNIKHFLTADERTTIMQSGQRQTHVYIIGQPGVGKSRMIESWFMQDVLAGNGAGIIDPHGDLFNHLVARIASYPEVWERVIIIDPCNPKWAVPINPLSSFNGDSATRSAWFLSDVILKIWSLKMTDAPRMSWLMGNTFSALAELRLPLTLLPHFLLHADFRDRQIGKINNHETRTYFEYEFPKTASGVRQWAAPLLNKMGELLYDPDIRCLLSTTHGLDFRQLIDDRCIVLVNIPKGILGENTSALLGAFLVAMMQKAALARANANRRNPFYLYLDEFQNYTTDNIRDILSESRKYALALIIANQYIMQLTPEIREAVLNTSGSLVSFRVGYNDASKLARHIFPSPDFLGYKRTTVDFRGSGLLPKLRLRHESMDEGWEVCAQALAGLPMRNFWMRSRSDLKPKRFKSLDMPDPSMTPEIRSKISDLVERSGNRYARLKSEIRESEADSGFNREDYRYGHNPESESSSLWNT
jgi:hypothetical protein